MPPKTKKTKSTKKTQKKPTLLIDEVDTTILKKDKLQEYCIEVYEMLTKEKQYTESLKLERDNLKNVVTVGMEQLGNLRNSICQNDADLQDTKENHMQIMGEARQKLINLAAEKNIERLNTSLGTIESVKRDDYSHEKRILELYCDIKTLTSQLSNGKQLCIEEKNLWRNDLAEQKSKLRQHDKEIHVVMENKRERILNNEIKNFSLRFQKEYNDLEKLKNNEITRLIKNHAKFANNLNHYYNKIVYHNLSVIHTMKNSVMEIKSISAAIDKQFSQLLCENKYLEESLNQSIMEEEQLREKLASSKRDQTELKYTKLDLKENNTVLEHMKWELETLNIRFEKEVALVKEETNRRQMSQFMSRATAEEYILLLEYIVMYLYRKVNEINSTLHNIKNVYTERGERISELEYVPTRQDTSLDQMTYQLTTMALVRERLISVYEQTLHNHHIHPDDTGFRHLGVDDILNYALDIRVEINENAL